jgi:hypothetical protein
LGCCLRKFPDPTPEADPEKEDFLSRNGDNDTKLKKWKRKDMEAALDKIARL